MNDAFPIATLGFIGAGNMAGAIIRGIIARGLMPADRIHACDKDEARLKELRQATRIGTTADAPGLLGASDAVVLAVKPQDLPGVLDAMAPAVEPRHLLISIAAGVRLATIAARLPAGTRLVRVMPNSPALVGLGAAGVAAGPSATEEYTRAARGLFEAVGIAVALPEEALDAVTALSGSGPAYVFRLMELMTSAGVALGLDAVTAHQLTLQTVRGAAELAAQSGELPAELRWRVTSPGGTTAAALDAFEARDFAGLILAGLTAARDRSIELAGGR